MRSWLLRATLVGAVATVIGSLGSPAQASVLKYTFGDVSGFLYLQQNQRSDYVQTNGDLGDINAGVLIKGVPIHDGGPSRLTNPNALRDRVF